MKINQWKKNFDQAEILKKIKIAFKKKNISENINSRNFENKISKFLGIKYVVLFTSGTTSILASLLSLNLKKKDEIILSNRGWISAYNAAMILGLRINFVDVEAGRPIIDLKKLKKKITSRTKVIMPIHMGGRICNMRDLIKIAKKNNIKIIEDAAQAFGSKFKKKYAGTFSDMGCFSLSIAKTISSGQGGFVVTNNRKYYLNLKKIKNNGLSDIKIIRKWGSLGLNLKFNDILSIIGSVDLNKFNYYKKKLINNYNFYFSKLRKISHIKIIEVKIKEGEIPQYIEILAKKRNELFIFMKKNKVDCRIFYPNLSSACKKKRNKSEFFNSNQFQKYGIYLPSGPDQSNADIVKTCNLIKKFYQK